MQSLNRLTQEPLRTPRTVRRHPLSVMTSFKPGLCVPIAAMPLLREDSLSAQNIRVECEMMETHELLMNRTNFRVTAYVVPKQAFDRFQGSRDQLDRSYMGQPQIDGGVTVPYFETSVMAAQAGTIPFYNALGIHAKVGQTINTEYLEAYNQIINMRLKNRSPNLAKRGRLDANLAPAFWLNSQWEHVKPDFDQATMDGEVMLNVVNPRIPISGLGLVATSLGTPSAAMAQMRDSTGVTQDWNTGGWTINRYGTTNNTGEAHVGIRRVAPGNDFPDIYAIMQNNNLSVSLADLAMAKKAQWFAKLRENYQGWVDGNALDEYIIDMLMSGLSIPDQAMRTPMLAADVITKFAQSKRYASDYANMAESAVSGAAAVEFDLRVPRLPTGGIVMIMAEALPDQLFERQADPYLFTTSVASLPDALRDELDTQKVDIVTNAQVDVDHATPAGTFGYEPLNGKWNRWGPRLGGKFHRPAAGATNDEVRQRLWAVEQVNPALGTSFYLVPTLNLKPFLDTVNDPFEVTVSGAADIEGNTVFGPELVENTNLYQKVIAKNPVVQAKP